MRSLMKLLLTISLLLACPASSSAQEVKDLKVDNPGVHADRKEMLDLLRARMKAKYKVTCTYTVKHFKMANDWAWLMVDAREEDFSAINFEDDFVDCCHVETLFQKVKGKWYIADYGAFSTDVWWEGIAYRHPKAPIAIFDKAGAMKPYEEK